MIYVYAHNSWDYSIDKKIVSHLNYVLLREVAVTVGQCPVFVPFQGILGKRAVGKSN